MQKWLARFSFSFLVLAAVLAWDAYQRLSVPHHEPGATTRLVLDCAGAGACAAMGVAGVRARHRDSVSRPTDADDLDK